MQEQLLDQVKVQSNEDRVTASLMPLPKDFESFSKLSQSQKPSFSNPNLGALELLGSIGREDRCHDFATKQPDHNRDRSAVPPKASEKCTENNGFDRSLPRSVEAQKTPQDKSDKDKQETKPGLSDKERMKIVEELLQDMASPRLEKNGTQLQGQRAPERQAAPTERQDLDSKPDPNEKVNNLAEKAAERIAEKGDISLLSNMIAMGANPKTTVEEVNKALEKAGSPLRVKTSEGETKVCFGPEQGSYRMVSLSLHGKDGNVIQSTTPVDEWANRKQSSGRTR